MKKRRWKRADQAYFTAEWVMGKGQGEIAREAQAGIGAISDAIADFIEWSFPKKPIRAYEYEGYSRQELAKAAASLWAKAGKPFVAPTLLPAYRPIDMGGPRDVWLEFYPPSDPRFDNMAPVSACG